MISVMRARIAMLSVLLATGIAAAAGPPQSLFVKLEDSSTDPSIAHMRLVVQPAALTPGRVVIQAENRSRSLVHEVIVVKDAGTKELPYDGKESRVVEKRIKSLGEIPDLAPGQTGKLTLDLKAGTYLLICNQPGHYKDGMTARVVVAR